MALPTMSQLKWKKSVIFYPLLHLSKLTFWLAAVAPEPFVLKERYSRKPMKMDAPEKVISQAHGEAQTITDFLHENGSCLSIAFSHL